MNKSSMSVKLLLVFSRFTTSVTLNRWAAIFIWHLLSCKVQKISIVLPQKSLNFLVKWGSSCQYQPTFMFLKRKADHILTICKKVSALRTQIVPYMAIHSLSTLYHLFYLIAILPQVMSCTSSNGPLPHTLMILQYFKKKTITLFWWGVIPQLIDN